MTFGVVNTSSIIQGNLFKGTAASDILKNDMVIGYYENEIIDENTFVMNFIKPVNFSQINEYCESDNFIGLGIAKSNAEKDNDAIMEIVFLK